eukprot:m.313623 g.313623  ORF g.313623 m.313623 type:complete len:76 (-) comp19664_c0_seq11:131-358(-)
MESDMVAVVASLNTKGMIYEAKSVAKREELLWPANTDDKTSTQLPGGFVPCSHSRGRTSPSCMPLITQSRTWGVH